MNEKLPKINQIEHPTITNIKEQRKEQQEQQEQQLKQQLLATEEQKKKEIFLKKSEELFNKISPEYNLLDYVSTGNVEKWLRYSEDPSVVVDETTQKKIHYNYTPAKIVCSDESVAVSMFFGKHCHTPNAYSVYEVKVCQDEDGESTVFAYRNEYTVDGCSKEVLFEGNTLPGKLKGQSSKINFTALIGKGILAIKKVDKK